jgi:protein SCO1/2
MRTLVFLYVSIVLSAVGCASDTQDGTRSAPSADSSAAVQVFEGRGLVTSVTPNRSHLVIDHEDMPGFMSAMKMPFALKDTSVATGVSARDSVHFIVEVDGPYTHIVRLEIIGGR